jgi:hypothetical protein
MAETSLYLVNDIRAEIEFVRRSHDLWPGVAGTGFNRTEGRAAIQAEKKNFAQAFSDILAMRVANGLRPQFPGILPRPDGSGLESKARSAKGFKQLDVNYSTIQLGLGLGVSIKTLNFRDVKSKRYTKNFSRIDNELRAEAQDYHTRQPYAVLSAIVFLPIDAAFDATARSSSSFGQAVQGIFRFRTGRVGPEDLSEKMEQVFIALYQPGSCDEPSGGELMGQVVGFDVSSPTPWSGLPDEEHRLTFSDILSRVTARFDDRNGNQPNWSDKVLSEDEKLDLFANVQELANEEPDDE